MAVIVGGRRRDLRREEAEFPRLSSYARVRGHYGLLPSSHLVELHYLTRSPSPDGMGGQGCRSGTVRDGGRPAVMGFMVYFMYYTLDEKAASAVDGMASAVDGMASMTVVSNRVSWQL
jgi:hypothetical protein